MTDQQLEAHIGHIGRIYEQIKDAVYQSGFAAQPEAKTVLDGVQELRNIACEFAQKLNDKSVQ